MSVLIKFCGFLFALLFLAVGAVFVLDGLGLTGFVPLTVDFLTGIADTYVLLILGILLFLIGLVLILAFAFVRPAKVAKVPGTTGQNDVYVTLGTIQEMVKRTAFSVPGVVGIHTKIQAKNSGLRLNLKVKVNYEDRITAVTHYLQDEVKTVIETSTSLPVRSVKVLVTKADTDPNAPAVAEKRAIPDQYIVAPTEAPAPAPEPAPEGDKLP